MRRATSRTSAASAGAGSTSASPAADSKKRGYANIWPEWNDADVNAEKWETTHKGGKEKEKGKSPVVSHFFEDPEGRIELPHILKIDYWKRPQDFIVDMTPVVVDQNNLSGFDLLSANEAVHDSELMRYITSEIMALWKHSRMKHAHTDSTACLDPNLPFDGEYIYTWRPWEHIYAINKVTKGPTIPLYNSHGKYAVRLYWLGCWRKIIVDDTIPYNEADQMLLPATTRPHEIWPMLLTKALVKVASLDYNGGNTACEFGDFSVIHCLTSWLPEPIPLQMGHTEEIWELLRASLPEFLLPELPSTEERAMSEERNKEETPVDEKSEKEKSNLEKVEAAAKPAAAAKSGKPDKDKGKDDKKDKKGQEKEKAKEKSIVQDELPIPDHPEYMVFASYIGPLKYPIKVSALSDMANASESLRLAGFSHLYPHPVNIRQTRSCPLEPPPPPEKIPAWKLIRPRKKRVTPSDEPIAEPEPQKPIQTLEITSPFINYKVSPIPIPAETHRPRSTLTRGSTRVSSRPGTANPPSIEEGDEDVQQSDSNAEMTDTQNLLTVDNLPQETKISEVETISDLDPHTEVQEKVSSGKDKLGGGEKSAGKKRTSSSKTKSEKSDKPEKPEKSDKSDKEPDRGKSPGGKKKGASNRDSADMGNAVDAADLSAALEAQLDDRGAEETGSEAKVTEPSTTMQDIWMDFSIFCKCFKTLYIYHKTQTYPHNNKHSDIKTAVEKTPEEKLQNFLFVDNLKPTDIVVSFSALSHWNDPPPPSKEDSKLNMIRRDRESRGDALANENSSVTEAVASLHEITHLEQLTPGLLIAEPYSWKSLITGQPILRLRTTSIRTAVLSLPEGRHVLRFSMSSPFGCHLHICSTVNFVFGEEERVMAELTKESCRFTDNAIQVMTTLGKCITNFNDGEMFRQAWDEFYSCHCPYRKDPTASKCYHSEIFNEAFYQMLRKALIEPQLVSQEMAQAWRAFMFDCTTKNILGLHYTSSSRPTTGITSDRGSAKKGAGAKRREPQETKVDTVRNREPTAEDHVAAVKIQMFWRGYYVRNVKAARTPGTEENHHAHELLQKAWPVLEANLEQNGLFLFRNMFKLAPELLPKYSFYKDEWNKITYSDYQGNYPEQPSNTWFVVFREVFQVVEDMLCMPKLYTSVPTCMLRVVNNDTGEEIPRIFQKVAPYVYKKNTHGYTFMAEARSVDQGIPPGRWRLRLIGSLSPLPTPQHGEVNASFQTNELHDFYVPNDRNIIFRYSVKVSEDHLVSLQMATSKSDVVVRLEILDHEEVKTIATGKGHIVLPAFIFQKDLCPVTPAVNSQTGASEDETSRRSGSRMSAGKHGSVLSKVHGSASNQVVQSKKPRIGSGVHDGRGSHASTQQSVCSLEDDDERETPKPHKYIIQATVLRNSWPLSESQWVFVQGLKELEKAEIKVMSKDATNTPQPKAVPSKDTGTKGKDKTGKKAGGKADKEKDAKTSSRPASQHFDLSKPNWVLRVVSDATCAEEIEVKKDTERIDEIRAMKKAWEDAEPGRAAKAMQSRLQYLSTHLVKVQTDEEEAGKSDASKSDVTKSEEEKLGDVDNLQPGDDRASLVLDDAEPVLTLNNPNPPVSKEVLQDIDLTPFIRETMGESRLLDLEELQRQLEEKQREIQDFRLYREQVEKRRDTERVERNKLKIRQLELFEEMQATLDALRAEVNEPREALRQRLLAEEQHRQEELAAADAALRVEQERNAPSPKGKKSPKAKSAKKK